MAGLVRAGFSFAKNAIFSTSMRAIATTRQLNIKESKFQETIGDSLGIFRS